MHTPTHRTASAPIALLAGLALGLGGCAQSTRTTAQQEPAPAPAAEPTPPTDDQRQYDPYAHASGNLTGSATIAVAQDPWAQERPADAMDVYRRAFNTELPAAFGDGSPPETYNIDRVTDTDVGSDFDPDVSADGSFIVFASTQHHPSADIYLKRAGRNVITQLTSDPGHDVMPSIAPDGQRVAFASNRSGDWDLYVVSLDGAKPILVTGDSAHELHPSWSPDGTRLVYSRLGPTSGRWELWVVEVDNPSQRSFIGYGLFPEWAPVAGTGDNGADRILFQRSRERNARSFGIWTIDYADGKSFNPTMIASSGEQALINPTWSPDGQFVVYASVPNPGEWAQGEQYARPQTADLWMVDAFGRGRISLTRGASVDIMPTWAPDDRLYFVSNRGGHENLWSMDARPAVLAARQSIEDRNSATVSVPTE